MKNSNRLLALVLAIMLAVCLPVFALGETTEADDMAALNAYLVLPTPQLPLVDEPMTLTVTYPRNVKHGDFNTMWYLRKLEEKTGVKLEIQPIEESGWNIWWHSILPIRRKSMNPSLKRCVT